MFACIKKSACLPLLVFDHDGVAEVVDAGLGPDSHVADVGRLSDQTFVAKTLKELS